MSRKAFFAVLIVVLAGIAAIFSYRTETQLPLTVGQTAEFGGVSLRLDYATTAAARERGLAGRASIPESYGMLFVFPKDDRYGFWMKDTLVPLDIFWLDADGHVVSVRQDVAPSSYPDVFYPTDSARYVLETAAGFAGKYGISTGTPLLLKNFPSVSE